MSKTKKTLKEISQKTKTDMKKVFPVIQSSAKK